MHWSQFLNFLVSMFAITNPFGNLAIFIGLTSNKTPAEQRRIAIVTSFSVAITMLLIIWGGDYILKIFGISLSAFEAAGGLVILLIGLSMLQSKKTMMSHTQEEHNSAQEKDSIAVVPLTIPIIAGPGAMTAILIYTQHFSTVLDKSYLSGGALLITLFIGVILFFAGIISKILGVSGIKIATRIMGLILMAIATGMIASGLKGLFPGL